VEVDTRPTLKTPTSAILQKEVETTIDPRNRSSDFSSHLVRNDPSRERSRDTRRSSAKLGHPVRMLCYPAENVVS